MDAPWVDGPPDDALLSRATTVVHDEVGSRLCAWIDQGTKQVCQINIGQPCLCRQVAEAVLMSTCIKPVGGST